MRYYSIEFQNPNGGFPSGIPSVFTSHQQGIYNPACPEIEFDIANVYADAVITPTHLRIHNVPLDLVKKSRQYNGMNVTFKAGFKSAVPGLKAQLPLENPLQAGIIAQGVVQTCYGNWLGTDLVLDFIIWPNGSLGSSNTIRSFNTGTNSPEAYQFLWEKGSLTDAIQKTVSDMGIKTVSGNINTTLANPPKEPIRNYVTTFASFSKYIQANSVLWVEPPSQEKDGKGIYQPYLGVRMGFKGNELVLYDGTESVRTVELKYEEFIGQPTWVTDSGIVQSVHPLRNDIWLGYTIQYPKQTPTIVAPQYAPVLKEYNINESSAPLIVMQIRHVGKYRGATATSWCTYVNAGSAVRINPNNPNAGVPQSKVKTFGYEYTPTA